MWIRSLALILVTSFSLFPADFREDKAEEIITAHGLEDSLYKTVRVVDEDALMAALYEEVLTEEEVDEMYPPKVVWALVLKK